ncbi:MAG: type II toxin-antitoxin system RelB/DinJ family antitoxin [Treponema sp.]|nr:type II toxin-antitoxin system RelB/DinJ family antitoxin [Treponema sp.]
MIKTYEIDFDEELVKDAGELFNTLGTDIDTAINIFLKQAVLRKGFPFDVVIPESENEENCPVHEGVTQEEECAACVATTSPAVTVSPEIEARVAANEALVAEMRNEIGDKAVTPEFDENEDDGTHGDYEQAPEETSEPALDDEPSEEDKPSAEEPSESPVSQETADSENDDSEDEDETTPENLFDGWDVGEEEDIGCK